MKRLVNRKLGPFKLPFQNHKDNLKLKWHHEFADLFDTEGRTRCSLNDDVTGRVIRQEQI